MPHVTFVPFTGVRVREPEMLALGMSLPGLRQRAADIGRLPALGLLTLAGLTPTDWTVSYHEADQAGDAFADQVAATRASSCRQQTQTTLLAASRHIMSPEFHLVMSRQLFCMSNGFKESLIG